MYARLLLALGITMSLQAQTDPSDLLPRVRAQVSDTLDRLPRYMCTQTIDRLVFTPANPFHGNACDASREPEAYVSTSDRLRLDVAMTPKGEIYSWVGASRFSDRDLADLVHEGATSTGSFGAFLTAIFRGDAASFTPGFEQKNRNLAEFAFRVPYDKSVYQYIANGERPVQTGYSGSFLVDRNSGDLVHLLVRTDRLPADTGACYTSTTLDYKRVHLLDADFLLPSESRMRIYHPDGHASENRTVFSNCHEFLGESTISFGAPGPAAEAGPEPGPTPPPAPSVLDPVIPPGLLFQVEITSEINLATAAGGDSIKGRLTEPIKDGSDGRKVLVPTGAVVTARIVRIRRSYKKPGVSLQDSAVEYRGQHVFSVNLTVKLLTVDVSGRVVRLAARPYKGEKFPKKKGGLQRRVDLGTPAEMEEAAAGFTFDSDRPWHRLPNNLGSIWITAEAASDARKP